MEFGPGLPYTLFIWQDTEKIKKYLINCPSYILLIHINCSYMFLPEVKCANQSSISVSLANCNLITFERFNLGV